jgi:uncharacterized protein
VGPGAEPEDPEHEAPGELDGRERQLDPTVVTVWRLTLLLVSLFLMVPPVAVALALRPALGGVTLVAVLALIAVGTVWYPRARYDRWRWRFTPLALELQHGVILRRQMAVPYFRIQQIEITRGPVERSLDLATLQVTTASASGSASLPGISAGDAPQVRAELLHRASAAVGEHPDGISDAV